MGLFDFLFGSDESSTKQWGPRKFLILGERRNGGKLNSQCEFLLASPFRRGIVATMTMTACQALIRMMIMISNASNRRYAVFSLFLFKESLPQNFKVRSLRSRFFLWV